MLAIVFQAPGPKTHVQPELLHLTAATLVAKALALALYAKQVE
jgi:hypothetical protein